MSQQRRTRDALEQARRLEDRARTQLAAGISAAMVTVDDRLRRFVDAVQAESLDRVDVDDELIRALAVAIGEAVYAAIANTLGLTIRDPRMLPSSGIAGPGGPTDFGAVLVDTEHALLMDNLVVCQIDPGDNDPDTLILALALAGRINHSQDVGRITVAVPVDGAALLITELYALAARGGWSPALRAAVDQHVADLAAKTGTAPAVTEPPPDERPDDGTR